MTRTFRILALGLLLAAVVALVGCSGGGTTTPATTTPPTSSSTSGGAGASGGPVAVSITSYSFSPQTVTIKVGDTVTWTNNDPVAHTITGSGFDSGNVAAGQTFSQKFDTAGTFDYHCSIHPNMTGKVTVQ